MAISSDLPIIPVSGPSPGCVQGVLVLVQRLHRDRLMAARTEAILPTVPAPKLLVTAQTRSGPAYGLPFGALRCGPLRGPLRIMTILIGWQQCEGYIAPRRVSVACRRGLEAEEAQALDERDKETPGTTVLQLTHTPF